LELARLPPDGRLFSGLNRDNEDSSEARNDLTDGRYALDTAQSRPTDDRA
jgi:hypothetical protein